MKRRNTLISCCSKVNSTCFPEDIWDILDPYLHKQTFFILSFVCHYLKNLFQYDKKRILERAISYETWYGTWCQNICENAAGKGYLQVIKWARDNGFPWDEHTCSIAAFKGHLDVLKWCRKNECHWDEYTHYCALKENHLKMLTWCIKNGCPQFKKYIRKRKRK